MAPPLFGGCCGGIEAPDFGAGGRVVRVPGGLYDASFVVGVGVDIRLGVPDAGEHVGFDIDVHGGVVQQSGLVSAELWGCTVSWEFV